MEIEDLLIELGFDVVGTAMDAEEAVRMAAALRPDVVTMDINLGRGRDGISAAVEIFQRFGLRSVFVSAYGNAETLARAEPARPLGWVTKPISRAALQAALDPASGEDPA
jgi:DNA-binding NarL/FixJ family response regulator